MTMISRHGNGSRADPLDDGLAGDESLGRVARVGGGYGEPGVQNTARIEIFHSPQIDRADL